jgi:hypothetical protein
MNVVCDCAGTLELMRETMSYGEYAGLIGFWYGLGMPGVRGTTITARLQCESKVISKILWIVTILMTLLMSLCRDDNLSKEKEEIVFQDAFCLIAVCCPRPLCSDH